VGDDVITQAELDKRVEQRIGKLKKIFPESIVEGERARIARSVLDQMIDRRLILRLVRRDERKNEGKPYVSDAAVDHQIRRLVEKDPLLESPEDMYRMAFEEEGLERGEFRQELKEQLEVTFYLDRHVLAAIDRFVSPAEMRYYYNTRIDDFTNPVEISFRQILIKLGGADALERRNAVEKGLDEGMSFVELARMYSEDVLEGHPETAGRLWRVKYEDLKSWHTPIPDVLRKMKPGGVSDAVLTVRGLNYFYVEDVVDGEPKAFKEVQEEITRRIRRARENAEIELFLKELHKKMRVEKLLPVIPGESGAEKTEKPADKKTAERDGNEEKQPQTAPSGGSS
jgi:parvulin-like peptidyl-prolyl isomerase